MKFKAKLKASSCATAIYLGCAGLMGGFSVAAPALADAVPPAKADAHACDTGKAGIDGCAAATQDSQVAQNAPAAQSGVPVRSESAASPEDGKSGIEVVTVSARRTEENAQRVPVMITAFSAADLEKAHIASPVDMARFAGITGVVGNGDFVNAALPSPKPSARLRGSPNITQYFGDVPVPLIDNMPGLYFDLSSADVLKGPQGTLFGLASSAGSVVLNPAKPGDTFGGHITAGYGERGYDELEAVLDVPLIDDKLLLRIGVHEDHAGGYVFDQYQGKMLDARENTVARVSVTFKPTNNIETTLLVQDGRSSNSGQAYVTYNLDPNGIAVTKFGQAAIDAFNTQKALGPYVLQYGGTIDPSGTAWLSRAFFLNDVTTWDISDALLLKNNFSFRTSTQFKGFSATQVPYGNNIAYYSNGQPVPQIIPPASDNFYDELQASGHLFGGLLDYVTGASALLSPQPNNANVPTYTASFTAAPKATSASNFAVGNNTYGLYAHGVLDLDSIAEGLKLSAGIRYSWIYSAITQRQFNTAPTPILLASNFTSHKWNELNYLVSLTYQATPNTMLFITNSTGYGAPGFNSGFGIPPEFARYNPETLNNVEGGIKSTFDVAGWAVQTNLSGYVGFYNNFQSRVDINYTNSITGLPVFDAFLIRNAATAQVPGAEGEITLVTPDRAFEFYGTLLYNDAHFTRNVVGPGNDLTNLPFTGNSKWQSTANLNYHLPFTGPWGSFTFNANYTWEDKVSFATTLTDTNDNGPAFSELGIGLHWDDVMGHDGLGAAVDVKNVTDTIGTHSVNSLYYTFGWNNFNPVEPRTIIGRVTYAFD